MHFLCLPRQTGFNIIHMPLEVSCKHHMSVLHMCCDLRRADAPGALRALQCMLGLMNNARKWGVACSYRHKSQLAVKLQQSQADRAQADPDDDHDCKSRQDSACTIILCWLKLLHLVHSYPLFHNI